MKSTCGLLAMLGLLIGPGILVAQSKPSPRSPWDGFGLGSTAVSSLEVKVDGKPTRSELQTRRLKTKRADGGVHLGLVIAEGTEERETFEIVQRGKTPEELGLKVKSTRDATIAIDGKEFPVKVTEWENVKGEKTFEEMGRPDYRTEGAFSARRLFAAKDMSVQLACYDIDSPQVSIPVHVLDTYRGEILVGPKTVKVELNAAILSPQGSPMGEFHVAESVRKLDEEVEIGGKKIRCVVIDTEHSQSGPSIPMAIPAKGEQWLSNEVPGHVVKQHRVVELPAGIETLDFQLKEFKTRPEYSPERFAKRSAEKDRPQVVDEHGKPTRLGDWTTNVHYRVDHEKKEIPPEFSIQLNQVVEIIDDQAIIIHTKNLGASGWEFEVEELISIAPRLEPAGGEVEKEEIEILGERVACERRERRVKLPDGSEKITDWFPLDARWKKLVATTGYPSIQRSTLTVRESRLGGRVYRQFDRTIIAKDVSLLIAGQEVKCLQTQQLSLRDGKRYATDLFFHAQEKADRVASLFCASYETSFSHLLSRGEAEEAMPDRATLIVYAIQAAKLIPTLDWSRLP